METLAMGEMSPGKTIIGEVVICDSITGKLTIGEITALKTLQMITGEHGSQRRRSRRT